MQSNLRLITSNDTDSGGQSPAASRDAVFKSNLWMSAALFGVNLVLIGLVLAIGNVALVAALAIALIGGMLIPIAYRLASQALENGDAPARDTLASM